MDEVSMNDGLDAPETIAFGLGPAETAMLVLALLTGYALTATLPAVLGWPLALAEVSGAALLAWGRHQDRSLLSWSVLIVRFAVRRREPAAARLKASGARLAKRTGHAAAELRGALAWRGRTRLPVPVRGGARSEPGAATVSLRLLPASVAPGPSDRPVSRRVVFFALRGGAGRTTIGCEVAALLAARGRVFDGGRWRPLRTALLDVDRLPAASLRLGIPLAFQPADPTPGPNVIRDRLQRHDSGLLVLPGAAQPGAADGVSAEAVSTAVSAMEDAGADLVVLDVACDLGPAGQATLGLCDDIVVVAEPTAAGILDAYRSTAELRRLGLRDRLVHIANRCDDDTDLADLESDLDVEIVARIPEDAALAVAGATHEVTSLDVGGPAAVALAALAAHLNRRLLGGRPAEAAAGDTWGGRAG